MSDHFLFHAAAYVFLKRENELLFARRKNTGYMDGSYGLIAGHLKKGETATEAILREAIEEAGIMLKASDLEKVHILHRLVPTREYFDVFFVAEIWEGDPKIMEPDKCDDMRWFKIDKLPDQMTPEVAQGLKCYLEDIYFSDLDLR